MDNKVQVAFNTLTKIWGVGPATAHSWIAQVRIYIFQKGFNL